MRIKFTGSPWQATVMVEFEDGLRLRVLNAPIVAMLPWSPIWQGLGGLP